MRSGAAPPSSLERDKYLRGMCPAGCPTNHGGAAAADLLADEWRAWPAESRPGWPVFLKIHGREWLAEEHPTPPTVKG